MFLNYFEVARMKLKKTDETNAFQSEVKLKKRGKQTPYR